MLVSRSRVEAPLLTFCTRRLALCNIPHRMITLTGQTSALQVAGKGKLTTACTRRLALCNIPHRMITLTRQTSALQVLLATGRRRVTRRLALCNIHQWMITLSGQTSALAPNGRHFAIG